MRTVAAFAVVGLLSPVAMAQTAPAPVANCQLQIKDSLSLEFEPGGHVTAPVRFNDKPYRMMVDTGAYYSIMNGFAAVELGIKPQYSKNLTLTGWGGRPIVMAVEVDKFALGRLQAGKTGFMVDFDFGIADGLLGADFLYNYDLDFDFAKSKLNLISPRHCPGKVVHWTKGDYGTVPFEYQDRTIVLKVKLDGKEVEAILDTGAPDTVISLEEAADLFGWDEDDLAKGKTKPVFKAMSFGSVAVNNPSVRLVSDKESVLLAKSGPKMIVGMTMLRRLHLYIAYGEKTLYVTPATQY
jgi:predicted aspartyl protease